MGSVWDADGAVPHGGGSGLKSHGNASPSTVPAPGEPVLAPDIQRKNSAMPLLVVACVSSGVGILLAIPAAVLGIFAVAHQAKSPSRSARFTRWGWVAYAIGMTLTVLAGAILVGFAILAASGNN